MSTFLSTLESGSVLLMDGAMGTELFRSGLAPADCAAFHKKVFVPNNTVLVVVGDFDSQVVADELKTMTQYWKRSELPRPKLAQPAPKADRDV